MKAKLGSQRVASNDGISSFPVFAAPSVGTLLLFAAAAYVVIGWPIAFGGFGASTAGVTDPRELEQLSQSNVANQLVWISLAAAGACLAVTRVLRGAKVAFTAALFFLCAYL